MPFIFAFYLLSIVVSSLNVPVHVIAFNRPFSLMRCLKSIRNAYSFCHWTGDLTILIDGPRQASKECAKVAKRFHWKHGLKAINWQITNVGLDVQRNLAQSPNQEYWLVVEDDVEVSEQACLFVEFGLSIIQARTDLVGMSLTSLQWQIGANEHGRWRRLDGMDDSFSSILSFPAISTWAQLFMRDAWIAWKSYLGNAQITSIQGSIYEYWFSSSPATVWSRGYQSFMNMLDNGNLFYNLPDDQVLAISHREPGLNTKRGKGPNGILLYDASILNQIKHDNLTRHNYCLDEYQTDEAVFVNYIGLGFELQRNHYCFIKASRYTNVQVVEDVNALNQAKAMGAKIVNGLDYDGDERLWTLATLTKVGRCYIGGMLECAVMMCSYKAGKYPHHKIAKK